MRRIPWIGGNSPQRDCIHWQRRWFRQFPFPVNLPFIGNDSMPVVPATNASNVHHINADMSFDDIMAFIWRVQEWTIAGTITAASDYDMGADQSGFALSLTWNSILQRAYWDLASSISFISKPVTDEKNLFGGLDPDQIKGPPNPDEYLSDQETVDSGFDSLIVATLPTPGCVFTNTVNPPFGPVTFPVLVANAGLTSNEDTCGQVTTSYNRSLKALSALDIGHSIEFSGSGGYNSKTGAPVQPDGEVQAQQENSRFPGSTDSVDLYFHTGETDRTGLTPAGVKNVIVPNALTINLGALSIVRAMTFVTTDSISSASLVNFRAGGALTVTATKFFAFQNRLGQPVYDTATGLQINDPFA